MEDREILQVILSKVTGMESEITGMKSEITGIKSEITGIKSEITGMKSEITGMKSEITEIKQRVTKIEVTQENIIHKTLTALAEGLKGMNEKFMKLDQVAEDVEDIQDTVHALEVVTISNSTQIKELKIAR